MPKYRCTVIHIANEYNCEVDEVLIKLWDLGFDEINGPKDIIKGKLYNKVRKALNLPTKRDFINPEFWKNKLNMNDEELHSFLLEKNIIKSRNSRTIPRRAIKKLKAELCKIIKEYPQIFYTTEGREIPHKEIPKLNWRIIGHEKDIRYLTTEEVKNIHFELVKDFDSKDDPIIPSGISDKRLLNSALFRPHTSYNNILKYPTVEMAASALLHSLIHNHPFYNGNKRTALVSMLAFLDKNGLLLTCTEDELFKFVLQVAQHIITSNHPVQLTDRETMAIIEWIVTNSRAIEKGERPMPFRKLRKILHSFDCQLERPISPGSKINIIREVKNRKFLKKTTETLKIQIHCSTEGAEVKRNTINKLRNKLQLDEKHGIDSKAFYENALVSADEFIIKYRKTLDRLAKL
jgi:death-on-curing family protein